MEQTRPPLSIFSPADLGLIIEQLFRSPSRIRPGAAAMLSVASICLGFLGQALMVKTWPGINIPIWHASVIAALLLAGGPAGVRLERRMLVLLGTSLLLSCLIAWRGAPALQALNIMSAAFTMLVAIALPSRLGSRRMGFVGFVFALIAGSFSMVTGALRLLWVAPWREHLNSGAPRHLASIGRAALLTLPLLIVFGGLFVAADAVFQSQVSRLISPDIEAWMPHIFWFTASMLGAAGVFWCALGFEAPDSPEADLPEGRKIKSLETGIILGALTILFALFVAVQLRYLFGGRELVETTVDLTYAQYARRGFFELVTVAALLLPVLLLLNWARRRDGTTTLIFRGLTLALIVLLAVVMASALERLRIYADTFGLTELRVYPAAFLIFLAAVFLWFLVTVLRDRIGEFLWGMLGLGVVALIAINIANPDALIARTNTSRLNDGRSFDAEYAGMLGPDAVPVLISRLDKLVEADRCIVARSLMLEWAENKSDFRGWNYGRAKANDAVNDNEAKLMRACAP